MFLDIFHKIPWYHSGLEWDLIDWVIAIENWILKVWFPDATGFWVTIILIISVGYLGIIQNFIYRSFSAKGADWILNNLANFNQARIAQLVAYRLGTGDVPGWNPGKGENFSVKINNWIVPIWIRIYNSNMWRKVICNHCVLMTEI